MASLKFVQCVIRYKVDTSGNISWICLWSNLKFRPFRPNFSVSFLIVNHSPWPRHQHIDIFVDIHLLTDQKRRHYSQYVVYGPYIVSRLHDICFSDAAAAAATGADMEKPFSFLSDGRLGRNLISLKGSCGTTSWKCFQTLYIPLYMGVTGLGRYMYTDPLHVSLSMVWHPDQSKGDSSSWGKKLNMASSMYCTPMYLVVHFIV